jgi:uncharacterized damage-inducible protein DinB
VLTLISDDQFNRVVDAQTHDEDCRSVQTIVSHVVRSGYGYANSIREQFSMAPAVYTPRILSRGEVETNIDAMLKSTSDTLSGRWEMDYADIEKIVIHASWGMVYNLEQLLEHAIVHILRHRRRIEKFMQQAGQPLMSSDGADEILRK